MSRRKVTADAVATSPAVPSPSIQIAMPPLALSLQQAALAIGVPSWTIRESIMLGKLRAKKAGRGHVVLLSDLQSWLDALPDVEPSTSPSMLERGAARAERTQ